MVHFWYWWLLPKLAFIIYCLSHCNWTVVVYFMLDVQKMLAKQKKMDLNLLKSCHLRSYFWWTMSSMDMITSYNLYEFLVSADILMVKKRLSHNSNFGISQQIQYASKLSDFKKPVQSVIVAFSWSNSQDCISSTKVCNKWWTSLLKAPHSMV